MMVSQQLVGVSANGVGRPGRGSSPAVGRRVSPPKVWAGEYLAGVVKASPTGAHFGEICLCIYSHDGATWFATNCDDNSRQHTINETIRVSLCEYDS